MIIVQKYGGTSVGTAARIRRVSRRIAATVKQGHQVVAVVSAMGHTTDRLIVLAQSINPEPPARELDMLVANGETITAPLVAMCLQGMGVPAISLSGLQAGVRTSAQHSRARIQDIKPERILETLRDGKVVWDRNARTAVDYKKLGPQYGVREESITLFRRQSKSG